MACSLKVSVIAVDFETIVRTSNFIIITSLYKILTFLFGNSFNTNQYNDLF